MWTIWFPRSSPQSTIPRANGELYNICMDEPVDYGQVASYLNETRGLPAVEIPSRFHSNWMDNAKAKLHLGWRPRYDLKRLIDFCLGLRALRQRTAEGLVSGLIGRGQGMVPMKQSQTK